MLPIQIVLSWAQLAKPLFPPCFVMVCGVGVGGGREDVPWGERPSAPSAHPKELRAICCLPPSSRAARLSLKGDQLVHVQT